MAKFTNVKIRLDIYRYISKIVLDVSFVSKDSLGL